MTGQTGGKSPGCWICKSGPSAAPRLCLERVCLGVQNSCALEALLSVPHLLVEPLFLYPVFISDTHFSFTCECSTVSSSS